MRVLVVDDARFVRRALDLLLSSEPEIDAVDGAADGAEALAYLEENDPGLVILDIQMPGMDGISTLRKIKTQNPELPVIMMSAVAREGSSVVEEAMAAGALDCIDKSSINLMDFECLGRELLQRIRYHDGEHRKAGTKPASASARNKVVDWERTSLCVIGASTGGPTALEKLLRVIPSRFRTPIVIVQHMPVGFTGSFAERMNSLCKLNVMEASAGQALREGMVAIAAAGKHLEISSDGIMNTPNAPHDAIHRPSVDVAMNSAAKSYGSRGLVGVLLTGMGSDGTIGMQSVRDAGGITIAEDETTCVVSGMPRSAYLGGSVSNYLPLDKIIDIFHP